MNKQSVAEIIKREIGFWAKVPVIGCRLELWDGEYDPINPDDIRAMFKTFPFPKYVPDKRDCDDMAKIAVGEVAKSDLGNAFWLAKNPAHVFNVFISPDGELWAFAPQMKMVERFKDMAHLDSNFRLGYRSLVV